MQKQFGVLIWIIIVMSVLGCSKKAEVAPAPTQTQRAEDSNMGGTQAAKQMYTAIERKIIKQGILRFECSDLEETRARIEDTLKKHQGYIANDQTTSEPDRIQHQLVLRVPAERFDQLVLEICQGVKNFDAKEINTTDVTEEFYDVETRIKVKKELSAKYRQLLNQAKNVMEILAIEKQLGELQEDIEAMEGRFTYLQNQIALSTLTVTYYKMIPASVGFVSKFQIGFKNGWNTFVMFLVGLVNIWPFIFIGLICLFMFCYRRKCRSEKSPRTKSNPDE